MEEAVKSLDFLEAARIRDLLKALQDRLNSDAGPYNQKASR
jgi:protein-arginine kinase activator protein McsA